MTSNNAILHQFVKGLNNKHNKPIAIVTGLTETGLAVARSLSRNGVCVIGIIFGDGITPSIKSKHLSFLRGPDIHNGDDALLFYTELAGAIGEKLVLLPTGDENLLFVYRHREILKKYYRFYVWESSVLEQLTSKINLAGLADEYNLPVPPTVIVKTYEDIINIRDKLQFPVVIKPEYTHLWETEKAKKLGVYAVKALPVETYEELLKVYDLLIQIGNRFIIQQMILGPDENHIEYPALVERDGEIKADFVAYKIRVAPAHFGMGCMVESTSSEDVKQMGREILSSLGYRGLAMVQFKRDDRDTKLYFLEINPRFTVWTSLPVACGIDFPFYYYQYCLGETYIVPDSYIVGKRWWNPLRDVYAMSDYIKDGTWTWLRWLRSLCSVSVNAYFSWDDRAPGYEVFKIIAKSVIRKVRNKITYRLSEK